MDLSFDNLLSRISKEKTNNNLAREALDMVFLRVSVVARLKRLDAAAIDAFWWKDKKLMMIFKDLYEAGVITLPNDPVDRLRWIALLCVECSKSQGFDCGNVVLPPDYVVTEELQKYEDLYGPAVIADVNKTRDELKEKGWKAVFDW